MSINKELLDLLACPKCKQSLELTKNQDGLICSACKKVYPIEDDIPILLIEEAIDLETFEQKNKEKEEKQC